MNAPIVIFLDFDGVTHHWLPSASAEERFQYLPRIEDVLRCFAEVRIVICSDWRKNTPWSAILSVFAEDIRPRVIGMTPVFSFNDYYTGLRHAEAQAYLKENNFDPERWVALDDIAENWIDDARVVVCNDGFFDDEEARLTEALLLIAQTPAAVPQRKGD